MREHKYKFWLGHTKQMTYAHTLAEIAKLGWDLTEDIIPLEYTGLKDSDGVEIYEGDIIIVPDWRERGDGSNDPVILEVRFESGLFSGGDEIDAEYLCFLLEGNVIGNVFENPEMLT